MQPINNLNLGQETGLKKMMKHEDMIMMMMKL